MDKINRANISLESPDARLSFLSPRSNHTESVSLPSTPRTSEFGNMKLPSQIPSKNNRIALGFTDADLIPPSSRERKIRNNLNQKHSPSSPSYNSPPAPSEWTSSILDSLSPTTSRLNIKKPTQIQKRSRPRPLIQNLHLPLVIPEAKEEEEQLAQKQIEQIAQLNLSPRNFHKTTLPEQAEKKKKITITSGRRMSSPIVRSHTDPPNSDDPNHTPPTTLRTEGTVSDPDAPVVTVDSPPLLSKSHRNSRTRRKPSDDEAEDRETKESPISLSDKSEKPEKPRHNRKPSGSKSPTDPDREKSPRHAMTPRRLEPIVNSPRLPTVGEEADDREEE